MEIKSKETGTEVMNLCFQTLNKTADDRQSEQGNVECDGPLTVTWQRHIRKKTTLRPNVSSCWHVGRRRKRIKTGEGSVPKTLLRHIISLKRDKYKGPNYNIYDSYSTTRNGGRGSEPKMKICESESVSSSSFGLIYH